MTVLTHQIKNDSKTDLELLANIHQQYKSNINYCAAVCQLVVEQALASGNTVSKASHSIAITWLLKYALEQNELPLNRQQVDQLFSILPELTNWQCQLHLLQSLIYIPFKHHNTKPLVTFLRNTLTSDNKFVRAWSYNGWYLLAKVAPEYQQDVSTFFNLAMQDEVPSVKARIRQLNKQANKK